MQYELTQEYLKSILHYNPETGIFTWIANKGYKAKIGVKAGYVKDTGYVEFKLDNKLQYAHRLAFLYMIGRFPINQVDHMNMIRNDNRWCNLREATVSNNHGNINKHLDNTSGYKGVWWSKQREKWIAQIMIKGVRYNLGSFNTVEEAKKAYDKTAKDLFKDFARL